MRIVALLSSLALVLASGIACRKRGTPDAARVAAPAISFDTDPIRVPQRGEISRAAFRAFVSVRLAGPWLRFLALDKAVAHELTRRAVAGPSRALLAHVRAVIRAGGLLREWLPAANGPFEPAKAELDLAWCLSRIWLLRGSGATPSAEELRQCFHAEVDRRSPELDAQGAVCEGLRAGDEEVYPELLALLTPEKRSALLLEAIR